ncbi:MAG: InlB B-repeat-containing protein [Clostridium sp.]
MIMKGKMKFCILAVFVLTVAAMWFGTKEAGAFTIAEDGKLNLKGSDKEVANIDGQSGKVIKFNVDEGETVLNVSELTNGVVAYNEIRKFSGWAKSSATVDTIEELSIDDFNSAGSLGGVEYTNGCSLYALFLGDEIEQQEEYRVLLNGNGGEITGSALPGQTKILLTYKEDELKSLDVSKYAAEREGCTFCGWGCNGEILTSALDKSYFKSGDSLVIYALYKKTTFEGTSYVLNLDANGGMIEDEFVKKYDYLGADDMVMPVFHYIPQRSGYRFKGWNSKKDGSGKTYQLISSESWRKDNGDDLEKDVLLDNERYYKYVTLYALWEKEPNTPNVPEEDEVTVVSCTGGSVELELPKDEKYSLEMAMMTIPEALAKENLKYLLDINLMKNQEIVQVNGCPIRVKLILPDELKDYDSYEVVYVKDGKIMERFNCTVEDGCVIFNTMHLSLYGIVAKKNEPDNPGGGETGGGEIKDPNKENGGTGDNGGSNTGTKGNGNTNTNNTDTTDKKEIPKDNNIKEKITVKRPYISKKHLKKNRKRVKIYWKKVKGVSGYEIQYSTSKKFTKKTTKQMKVKHTNKWIRLKGKKKGYYARIRAYKIVNGKKYYSKWSKRTVLRKQKK